jgi:hypothetical protein
MRFDREQLRYLALMALDEIADRYREEPCKKALWLRFLLAWLYRESGAHPANKWMFTGFWKAATRPIDENRQFLDGYSRKTELESCLNGITRVLGWERTVSFMQEMERRRSGGPRRREP